MEDFIDLRTRRVSKGVEPEFLNFVMDHDYVIEAYHDVFNAGLNLRIATFPEDVVRERLTAIHVDVVLGRC